MKYFLLISICTFILSSNSFGQWTEVTALHFSNNDNDTSKVCYRVKILANDSPACTIEGRVIDRVTSQPIPDAIVAISIMPDVMWGKEKTDRNGVFKIDTTALLNNEWVVLISAPNYENLIVKSINQFANRYGIYYIDIKLKKNNL